MIVGKKLFKCDVSWHLNGQTIDNFDTLEILGCCFNNNNSASSHIEKRKQKCCQSILSLSNVGTSYPGLDLATKRHLWQTVCSPSLTYGCESLMINNNEYCDIDKTQSTLVKRAMGFCKRSHHSNVLRALRMDKSSEVIKNNVLSLYYRIFQVASPTRDLCIELLSSYMCHGKLVAGTLIDKVVNMCQSPIKCAFNKTSLCNSIIPEDGVVDSLRYLLYHENFMKPYGNEHVLATLLTKAF